jgi:hypothetical protein
MAPSYWQPRRPLDALGSSDYARTRALDDPNRPDNRGALYRSHGASCVCLSVSMSVCECASV